VTKESIVSGSMAVYTYLGNAMLQTTHSGTAGMLRAGLVIVERQDVLDLARALSVWHVSNVREGAPGVPLDGIPFGLATPVPVPGVSIAEPNEYRGIACKRCGSRSNTLHFDGDRQVDCAGCRCVTDKAIDRWNNFVASQAAESRCSTTSR